MEKKAVQSEEKDCEDAGTRKINELCDKENVNHDMETCRGGVENDGGYEDAKYFARGNRFAPLLFDDIVETELGPSLFSTPTLQSNPIQTYVALIAPTKV